MSKQTVENRMTHRALVERDGTTARDGYGAKQTPSWASHIASQRCFFYRERGASGGEERERSRGTVQLDALRIMVPLGTDITAADRINGITERDGTVVEAGYMSVTAVTTAHNHLEVRLEKVA